MKVRTLLETPIGDFASASLQNQPELLEQTPDNTRKLVAFALENHMSIEGVLCAVVNWMGTNCEDSLTFTSGEPNEYIN